MTTEAKDRYAIYDVKFFNEDGTVDYTTEAVLPGSMDMLIRDWEEKALKELQKRYMTSLYRIEMRNLYHIKIYRVRDLNDEFYHYASFDYRRKAFGLNS